MIATLAVALSLAAVGASCSSGSSDAGGDATTSPAVTVHAGGTTSSSTTTPRPTGPVDPNATLQAAGKADGLMIGTALKFGAAREAIEDRQFSGVTAENQFLWSSVHPAADRFDFTGSDRVVNWAQAHHKDLTATHFVWDPPGLKFVLPQWVRDIDDPAQLRAAMRDHLTKLHDRYAGKIDRWNVVNEALAADGTLETDNHFFQVLGPGYVAEAFRMAAEIWPEAKLVLNENLTEYLPSRADGLVKLVKQLIAAHVRVDRVGLQTHLFLGEPNFALAQRTMERITALGVPVDITELDIPLTDVSKTKHITLQTQADWGRRIVEACLAVPTCESITFWGFDDGDTWLTDFIEPGTKPLLYDEHLKPKPFYRSVLAALEAGRPK